MKFQSFLFISTIEVVQNDTTDHQHGKEIDVPDI